MLKFLRSNQQVFTVFIFAYCFISVFTIYIFHPEVVYSTIPFRTPFFGDFTDDLFSPGHKNFGFTVIAIITLLIVGFFLVRININHLVLTHRSQFPALFFISVSSLAFQYEVFSSVLIAAFFLLIAVDRLFGAIHKQGLSYRFLDAGILIGLGSLFYFNLIFFFPFLCLAQFILRPFNVKELIYTFVGLAIPFLYIFSGYFLFNLSISDIMNRIKEWLLMDKIIEFSLSFVSGISFYLLIVLIANISATKKFATAKIYTRKLFQLWFYLFLNSLLLYFLIPATGIEILILLAIPTSVLLSLYFSECPNNLINRLLLFLILTVPIVINVFR